MTQKGSNMTELTPTGHHSLALAFRDDLSPAERSQLQAWAMEPVADKRFPRKVPRFMLEMPFGGDADEISLRIAGALLVAPDPDAFADENKSLPSQDLVAQSITVWDLFVMPSDQPNGLAGYLMLDVTVGNDPTHQVVNTGAPQAIARLARAWFDGGLPIKGAFAEIAGTGKRGSAAITFIADLVQEQPTLLEAEEPF